MTEHREPVADRGGDDGHLTVREACQRARVPVRLFRQLSREFPDLFPVQLADGRKWLAPDVVERLRSVGRWREQGLDDGQVMARLRQGEEPTLADDAVSLLMDRLATLNVQIREGERRRAEDWDRLITLLMRTQQELQHLRYEVSARTPRRRKRRGLLSFLFPAP
ncbi:MAG: hypothetical protein IRY95_08650 [Clostridia bacterium]|nr:hypothetical protein [Clostridia bacterium]